MNLKTDLSVSKVVDIASTLIDKREVIDLKYIVKNRKNMAKITVYENLKAAKDKKNFYLIYISESDEETTISMDFDKCDNTLKKDHIVSRYNEIFQR